MPSFPTMRKLRPDELGRIAPEALRALPRAPLAVVLEDVRSAHNVGAILRTADAVRAAELVCCGFTPAPDHPRVRKTALGAEATVPWRTMPRARDALEELRARGFVPVALELTDVSVEPWAYPRDAFPVALVVGNELMGVSDETLAACRHAVALPQHGAKHSLNVAVAFGVAAYALLHRGTAEDPAGTP